MIRSNNPYVRSFVLFIACIIPFLITRLALYSTYQNDFDHLSFSETSFAFLHGLRFDAAIIVTIIGFPLLFLMLPAAWAKHKLWQAIWLWFIYIVFLVFIFALVAEFIYFGFVHRHVGPEIHLLLEDISLMADIAITEHALALSLFAVIAISSAKLWHYLFFQDMKELRPSFRHIVIFFVLFFALVIVGRGGIQYKPLRVGDAFIGENAESGYLAINGPFSTLQSLRGVAPRKVNFMPESDAIAITQQFVGNENVEFIDPDFPLLRKSVIATSDKKPNIVFLLVESFDAEHFDALRVLKNQKAFGSTPNLDALAHEGRLYSNFFATGQRSMDGLAATLASIPTLPGMPYIGQGMEQNRLPFLGLLARQEGYQTIFLQSSDRGSFKLDSIAKQAGFEQYYGAEDIPGLQTDVEVESNWGTWDHNTLQYANKLFSNAKQPFVGYIFTSSTHNPWRIPNQTWQKHAPDDDRNNYLNSLYYFDWAIGEFFKSARNQIYFSNTIFIITGDHISRFGVDSDDLKSKFHIPLILYGTGISPEIDSDFGNQMDILPTIIELANWNAPFSGLGKSLLHSRPTHFSFSVNGNFLNYLSNNQNFYLNLDNDLVLKSNAQLKLLLGEYQLISNLFMENKIYR